MDADLVTRLVVSAALGGLVGLERELTQHPAGTRTHLLVSLGAALFTIISIYGFPVNGDPRLILPDPARVAAQIVTGIGFLGAGVILKYGTTIRGLTTAGSLWATAAIGMAVGAGAYSVAIITTAIVLLSLWPLNALIGRLQKTRVEHFRLVLDDIKALEAVTSEIAARGIDIRNVRVDRNADERIQLAVEARVPRGVRIRDLVGSFSAIGGVHSFVTGGGDSRGLASD